MNTNQAVNNQPHTIKTLRQASYKTRCIHERLVINEYGKIELVPLFEIKDCGMQNRILNYGGNTIIEITTPDGKHDVVGESKCSKKDAYQKKYGVNVALGRAVSELVKLGYLV